MAASGSNKKVANSLVVMSSAAVLAVYSAGYVRTRPAAERLERQAYERSLVRHAASTEVVPVVPVATTSAEPGPRTTSEIPKSSAVKMHAKPKLAVIVAPETTEPVVRANAMVKIPAAAPAPLPIETPQAVVTTASIAATPAATPVEAPTTVPVIPAAKVWKDGKYVGWGGSRHGDIQATVVIQGGRIVSAAISDCETRYPCDVIERLPPQVAMRQSPNVDRIGGATESSDAFYSAVYFALQQAK